MVIKCCVCKGQEKALTKFRFPDPLIEEDRFDSWIRAIGDDHLRNMPKDRIYNFYGLCERHFSDDQKLGPPGMKVMMLKKQVIPCLSLMQQPSTSIRSSKYSFDTYNICGICVTKMLPTTRYHLNERILKNEAKSLKTCQVLELISKFKYSKSGPQYICSICYRKTVSAYRLIQMCNNAESLFNKYVKDHQQRKDDIGKQMEDSSTQIPITMDKNKLRNEINHKVPVESVWLQRSLTHEDDIRKDVEDPLTQVPLAMSENELMKTIIYKKPVYSVCRQVASAASISEDEIKNENNEMDIGDVVVQMPVPNDTFQDIIKEKESEMITIIIVEECPTSDSLKSEIKQEHDEIDIDNEILQMPVSNDKDGKVIVQEEICYEEALIQMPFTNSAGRSNNKKTKFIIGLSSCS